jgi:predicted nucleic acid-binding protein
VAVWDERRVFVDTNILLYAMDSKAREKHERARAVVESIWLARTGVISTQILSEWIVNLQRKLAITWRRIGPLIQPYLTWTVVAIEPADPPAAAAIADRHTISYWDALVVQAARKGRAVALLTEDLNPGQKIEGVEIVNPL